MSTSRALLQDADSLNQRSKYLAGSTKGVGWYEEFVGLIRSAAIYSEQVVLLDAQIFDGAVFLHLGPDGVADLLGRGHYVPEIAVALRADSAAASLKAMSSRSFIWQVRKLGWTPAQVRERQQAWVDAIDARRFPRVEVVDGFDFAGTITSRLSASTPELPTALAAALTTTVRRSDAHTLIERSALDIAEQLATRRWWDAVYMDTIAMQREATWIDSETSAQETIGEDTRDGRIQRISTPIKTEVVTRLAAVTGDAFAALRSGVLPRLRAYNAKPTRRGRRRIGLIVMEATSDSFPLVNLLLNTLRVVGWGAVLAALLITALPLWVGIVAAVLVALSQVPFDDLVALARYARSGTLGFNRRPL